MDAYGPDSAVSGRHGAASHGCMAAAGSETIYAPGAHRGERPSQVMAAASTCAAARGPGMDQNLPARVTIAMASAAPGTGLRGDIEGLGTICNGPARPGTGFVPEPRFATRAGRLVG